MYAALAYYFDHREKIQRQANDDEELVAKLKSEQGVTKFDLLKRKLGLDDEVSFG